ncbi:MAG TPA: GNAT family N-acetyltransferase [Candidatus Dormibacteraeota bacterium]|nr:GNAT family N-acetyltransferase [Candidatus Dormibacteraeota bacterium]
MTHRAAGVHIEEFDPATDGDALRACYRMFDGASAVDDPNGPRIDLAATSPPAPLRGLMQGGRSFVGWWSHGLDGHPQRAFLAADARSGEPAACCVLELPSRDDTGIAFCLLVVPPERRRHGIGTALLVHARDQARRAGRSMLIAETRQPSAGDDFARAIGAQAGGTTDQRRVLDVDADHAARLAVLRPGVQSHAQGYEVLSWSGPARAPDVENVAAVVAAMADAPRPGGLAPERWDAERVRAEETHTAALGLTVHSVAARHGGSGELAALTQACIDPMLPGWAFQLATVVTRPHRGHNLGLLVKVTMHELLRAQHPDVRRIMTTNDASNRHIIAVNDQLGYRAIDTFVSWELAVG